MAARLPDGRNFVVNGIVGAEKAEEFAKEFTAFIESVRFRPADGDKRASEK